MDHRQRTKSFSSNFNHGTSFQDLGQLKMINIVTVTIILVAFAVSVVNSIPRNPPPVYIRDLKVPRTIVNGSETSIVLDCDYRLEPNDTTLLVVYWYLNHTERVYQWIYGKPPQSLGSLQDRVNLGHKASDVPFEEFRAIEILNPTTELSGEYSCKVSNKGGEAYKTAKMTIYSPAKEVDFKISSGPENETHLLNISCWATGVYPKPIVTLYYSDIDSKQQALEDVEAEFLNAEDDTFDIFIHTLMDKKDIAPSTRFTCDLKITDTNYYVEKYVYWQNDRILESSSKEDVLDDDGDGTVNCSSILNAMNETDCAEDSSEGADSSTVQLRCSIHNIIGPLLLLALTLVRLFGR